MTVNPNHNALFAPADYRPVLWERWMALRNGELAHIEEIVAPALALHSTNIGQGPNRVGSRRALTSWLSATRAALPAGRFTVQVGPIISDGLIAGRWVFSCDDRPDRQLGANVTTFTGTDILRVHDGQVVELWINHDVPGYAASLGTIAA